MKEPMKRTRLSFPVPLLAAGLMILASATATASPGLQVIPLAQYQLLNLESQRMHSPGAGVVAVGENLLLVGLYSRYMFTEDLKFDYPDTYHSIELVADGAHARHRYLGVFKSESDRPVVGGMQTLQAAAVYGYEVVRQQRFSLVLGGGLAIGDFGGMYAIPVPLIRASWESRAVNAHLDFITGPNLNVTLAPQSRLSATLDARVDKLRDERDLIFECALVYRLFSPDHPLGELASAALGVRSDAYEFNLEREDESLELHTYAVFGTFDLTLLTLSAGYAFDSRLQYRERVSESAGDGWFVSLSVMYPLGGSHDDR